MPGSLDEWLLIAITAAMLYEDTRIDLPDQQWFHVATASTTGMSSLIDMFASVRTSAHNSWTPQPPKILTHLM